MTQQVFERWNWEYDCGEHLLPLGGGLPSVWAIAYYDKSGTLYRAVSRVKLLPDASDDDPDAFTVSVYDYFCTSDGRVIQKRALDDNYDVALIVDFDYDLERNQVTETAWSPVDGTCKSWKHPIRDPRPVPN